MLANPLEWGRGGRFVAFANFHGVNVMLLLLLLASSVIKERNLSKDKLIYYYFP